MCLTISALKSPGVIRHFGVTPTIIIGEINHSESERVKILKDLFDSSGITSVLSDDIEAELWKKFISICVSGLFAITRSTCGELRELSETRNMMIALLTEVYELALAFSIKIITVE